MKRPSVLFINRVYPPQRGATGRLLRDLAQAFAREGWDVTVLATGPRAAQERDGPVSVIRRRGRAGQPDLVSYLFAWLRLLEAGLRLQRHDLVVTMTDPPLLVAAGGMIARLKHSRHINWCQDLYPDMIPALGMKMPAPLLKFFMKTSRRALKSCDGVVVIGRCMAGRLAGDGIDSARLTVVQNWPDTELAASPPPGQVGDPFRVLYAGNLGRAHPADNVLDAAADLAARRIGVEFIFVGDGPSFDRLARERTQRGLENIRFLPFQPPDRLPELMASGDAHLITMTDAAAGLLVPSKLYSALAAGRPCIFVGPASCEAARIIQEFGAGLVVPQDDAAALSAAIRRLRVDNAAWLAARTGAMAAARQLTPAAAQAAWLDRARLVTAAAGQPQWRTA